MCQCPGAGNTPSGMGSHPQWARLTLRLIRQGDAVHQSMGQPLFRDSYPLLLQACNTGHLQALDGSRGQFLQVALKPNAPPGECKENVSGDPSSDSAIDLFLFQSPKRDTGAIIWGLDRPMLRGVGLLWGLAQQNIPYYNPQLSLVSNQCGLKVFMMRGNRLGRARGKPHNK
ncbi:hypothetical protein M9458_050633 [Cirrhinus mrigala]|uniref:Uncharacterized protein n=1 Tax=Cirrhinus mrigala TaxID=683832 RepID=A0ABD0MY78_CIRMR